MAKQRKTRKQKQQADQRKQSIQKEIPSSSTSSSQYTYSLTNISSTTKPTAHTPSQAMQYVYDYVAGDLQKTLFMTTAIVFAQIVVYIIANTIKH